jgi:hypothetical protein
MVICSISQMVEDIFEDDEKYVCVSHMMTIPCPLGDHHLVSNWPSDVVRVLDTMNNNR